MSGSCWVKARYRQAAKELWTEARNYWLNEAFLRGEQWVFYDKTSDTPRTVPDDGRLRYVINRMAANHRTIMGNATQRYLAFEVQPSGASDGAHEAAALSEKVLHAVHEQHDWEQLREQLCHAVLSGGTAAICQDYDEGLGDTVETVLTIADFVVEPGSRKAELARWWVKSQLLPPEEVQARYGLAETPDADATNGLNPLQSSMLASHLGLEQEVSLTQVLTCYERPNHLCPEGRVATSIGDKIVEDMPWNFPFKHRLNLKVAVETPNPNRWYGRTIYSQARGPQVLLNYAKSNLAEHLRDVSAARMLVPHSAVYVMQMLDDVPGNMYPYPDNTAMPSWLTPPQLPAWLQGLPIDFAHDIDDLMGVHDISRGRAPANLESGSALSILAEQDGTPVGRLTKELARVFGDLAQDTLRVYQAEVRQKREALIETKYGPLPFTWQGKDIAGEHNARVPHEAIIPRSRAAQEQRANLMVQMGMIQDPVSYIRASEMPGQREIMDTLAPGVAKARRMIARIARGEVVLPATFDPHEVMIPEYNHFRLSDHYDRMRPEWQQNLDTLIQGHETLAAEAAAKMAMRTELHPALGAVPSADADPAAPPALPEGAVPPPAPPPEPEVGDLAEQLLGELG